MRPCVRGKFLFVGDEKFYVKGVTYGTFRPDNDGDEYPAASVVENDFAQMAANGINAVRTYTVPPRWLLDAAERHGLRVMVGLAVERYVGYLIDKRNAPDISALVREKVRACAGHPAILWYAIANEIPAPMVRWLGALRVERFLERLCHVVKAVDPKGLVTYVNYPSTEYLRLPSLDLVCFNVYLESQERLAAYLARLQNLTDGRPLIMSELGLDSIRNGEDKQACVLDWQVRCAFASGCAGAFVYAWTDEWYRAGAEVDDWDFGLTRRDRQPKPALAAVHTAFNETPFDPSLPKPRFSVIVCSHNGTRTIRDCLGALKRLKYPNYEVIVVNDGSTDGLASVVSNYDVRLISTENKGLSHARNVGLQAASGEFVAYIDDDAFPDPHWLDYLAASFLRSNHAGIGGPNLDPPGDGLIADCIANCPGGPVHVLLTDEIAEHIPGCNMAFRKSALESIGGFDPQFRVAGDDVDVCWRLQECGWTLGFCPAAMVWHHSRNSVRAYWRQQKGYGKAEALLEAKWPGKYNSAGHHTFAGRIYGKGLGRCLGLRNRVYHGVWGMAPFQSLYQPTPGTLLSLPMMPEWFLLIVSFGLFSVLGLFWSRLLFMVPALIFVVSLTLLKAIQGARQAVFHNPCQSWLTVLGLRSMTASLHLIQPLARLYGRLRHGLTLWRRRSGPGFAIPRRRETAILSRKWLAPDRRLKSLEQTLRANRSVVIEGDEFARWDLEVRGGMFGAARVLMAVEEHGSGTQYVRVSVWPRCRRAGLMLLTAFAAACVGAAAENAWGPSAVFLLIFAMLALSTIQQAGCSLAAIMRVVNQYRSENEP